MRKLSLVISTFAVAATLLLLATSRQAQAVALNESDLPEEADLCSIQFTSTSPVTAGDPFSVNGRIFESSVTEGLGSVPGISAEVGFGPSGSDPRLGGWTYFSAPYVGDVLNEDEYEGFILAPSPVTTTDYAVTIRFSLDDGTDHTYCDSDGAGSNVGADFDPAQLGLMTVTGTGGSGEGGVTTSVDVIADPGACIILSSNAVSFGQETFSTQNAAQLGLAQVTVTSCSLTTSLDLLAKGTNAAGPSAAWELTDPPGSGNMCNTAEGGIDQYSQRVQKNDGLQGTNLALTNRTYMTGLAQSVAQPTDILLRMPCVGSSGTGETVSSTIMFTAIPGPTLTDADGDTYFTPQDCDDANPNVNPGAPEVANGLDDNCDGVIDEGTCGGVPPFVPNADVVCDNGTFVYICHPGFLDLDGQIANGCEASDADGDSFFALGNPPDCDDANAAVFPGATEVANGIDDDCDGIVDEGVLDVDGDTFTVAGGDCDDTNAAVNPAAPEILFNGIDDDCDGQIDEVM